MMFVYAVCAGAGLVCHCILQAIDSQLLGKDSAVALVDLTNCGMFVRPIAGTRTITVPDDGQ